LNSQQTSRMYAAVPLAAVGFTPLSVHLSHWADAQPSKLTTSSPVAPLTCLNRRTFLGTSALVTTACSNVIWVDPAFAEDTQESLQAEINDIIKLLDFPAINTLLDEEKWDNVRDILKKPPVNYAWEQSQNKKNPLRKLADLKDDVELFETVDDIAQALQLADQYCYSNTFIYTQPGNGKVKIKEPKQQLKIAADKMVAFSKP